MVEQFITIIYNRTYTLIREVFPNNMEMLNLYKEYLSDKYRLLLEDLLSSETGNTIYDVIDTFVEDEIKLWSSMDETEMRSTLEKDSAFDYLSFLSEVAFTQAKECIREKKYYNNDEEYRLRLEEVAECLEKIKPFNISKAKELLSETVLDIDFIFGKTNNTSIRLANTL